MRIIKNLFLFLILIAVIALSFWLSFTLGKNLLTPTKKIPTADLLTMEASILDEIGKITVEVEALNREVGRIQKEPDYMVPKVSGRKELLKQKEIPFVNYVVQTGLFSIKANARALVQQLKEHGFEARMESAGKYFKVFVPSESLSQAKQFAAALRAKGFEAIVRRK